MTSSELRELLMSGNHDEATYKKIPPEAHGLWFSRPKFSNVVEGRQYMRLRVFLIVVGAIYFLFFQRGIENTLALLAVITAYEFAYHSARKEISEHDDRLALERYAERVDEFLRGHYPKA